MWRLLLLLSIPQIALLHGTGEQGVSCDDWEPMDIESFEELECCFEDLTRSQQCLDIAMHALGETHDVKEMLREFTAAREKHKPIETNCHVIAHAIGRTSFQKTGNLGEAFHACDMSCHAGCYHGVLESLFFTEEQRAKGIEHLEFEQIAEKIPTVCTEQLLGKDKSVVAQCQHGLGHAILYTIDYDLPNALRGCDLLPTRYARESCYIGVFTENVIAEDKEKRNLKEDDVFYPCNAIDRKYQQMCYKDHTKVLIHRGMTDQEVAEACAGLPEFKEECFEGLGRDISTDFREGGRERAQKACEESSEGFEASCIAGHVYALLDNTGDGSFGFRFCESLKDPKNQQTCFRLSMHYLATLHEKNRQALLEMCTVTESGRTLCEREAKRATAGTLELIWILLSDLWL